LKKRTKRKMAVLYLLEQGSTLHKNGEIFMIEKEGQLLQKIHAIEIDQIIIFGNISLTTPAINYILEKGIDCVFCNSYGKYHGRLTSTESKFGLLRMLQMQTIINKPRKLEIARSIIKGKMQNQRTLLMRYLRRLNDIEIANSLEVIEKALASLDNCEAIDSLIGQEGIVSATYYRSFKRLLNQEMGFTARVKRPPTDPVNSLLSFGYTLLVYNIQSAVSMVGLDPYLGFLHSNEQARPNLALDLMEEFRPVIVDSLALWLINSHVMTLADFKLPEKPGEMVIITNEGIKKLIHYYEMKIQSKIFHPDANGETSYRHCFELQARCIARVIQNRQKEYKPFLIR